MTRVVGLPAHGHGSRTRLAVVAVLALSSAAPLLILLVQSVAGEWFYPALVPGALDGRSWQSLASSGLLASLRTSALIAVATGVVGAMIAFPVGRAMSRLTGARQYVAAALAFLPVAVPPIALATGLQVLLLAAGPGGALSGVVLAHLVPATGYLSLFFLGVFRGHDARGEEVARTLGASRWQTLARVTLPLLRRPVVEAVVLGFLVSWSQYALTLVIGAGGVRTLPLTVFTLLRAGQDRAAAVGALLLIVPPAIALTALGWAARRTTVVAT